MNKKGLTLLILLISLFIVSCAGLTEKPHSGVGQEKLIAREIFKGGYYHSPVSITVDDEIATLYLTKDGRVVFKRGDKVTLLDEDIKGKGRGRKPLLYKEGSRLYAIWWAKTKPKGDKHLYFRASYDGGRTFQPTRVINSENGVLSYSFASDGRGGLVFAYNDERNGPYESYTNVSYDYGRSWLDRDVRLDSVPEDADKEKTPMRRGRNHVIEPKAVIDGQAIVVTWKESRVGEGDKVVYYIKSRNSYDGGRSWEPEIVLRKSDRIFFSDNLVLHNNVIYFLGQENNTGITGYRSVDMGRTWEAIDALQGSGATVNSQLKVIGNGGYLYAVYTAEKSGEKSKIFFASFSCSTFVLFLSH